MLIELNIKNFAIIDAMNIAFSDGFNVISGETGAGKSIIIGAVSLLLGDRASAEMIRTDEDAAVVEALFDIRDNPSIKMKLDGLGLDSRDDLMIRRIISRSGKNRVYINGSLTTLSILSAIGESLMNICGQHEHQALLDADHHVDVLDEFGGLLPLRTDYGEAFHRVQTLRERQRSLTGLREKRTEREDFLRFQLREIAEAGLRAGEDAALQDEKKRLNNIEKLIDYANHAHDRLYGKSGCILEELKRTITEIRDIRRIDNELNLQEQALDTLYFQLEDAAFALRDYTRRLSFDPDRLAFIDDRLETLGRLKRKHGGTLEAVLAKQASMEAELEGFGVTDEEMGKVSAELDVQADLMRQKALALSQKRLGKAALLEEAIEAEIRALNMAAAQFQVRFKDTNLSESGPSDHFTERGRDDVEFYLSTNVGEALKPLNRIASGGELSRIILSMKKVLARSGSVSTIVFDEVDSGIGGATAEIVGEKLKEVALHHQVLCITHLPQIACFGDRHYRVVKRVSGGRANACMEILSREERLDEITRMLGGVALTKKTKDHAREMLEKAGGKGL
ncbi:MAG: DNA repair protein RecN [Deltaproteobacteria bacterium]|jgi:DNA repair protein RecN (Recombination protein N)|nr:DNA repair protein RecN [Deltaproteobacteria bacterium]